MTQNMVIALEILEELEVIVGLFMEIILRAGNLLFLVILIYSNGCKVNGT
jgi:hypothetical protein